MRWLLLPLLGACPGPDTDSPPVDPCDPDPCAGSPGTVCDAGWCLPFAVEVTGAGPWDGTITDLADGAVFTFHAAAAGTGGTAQLGVSGGPTVDVVLADASTVAIDLGGVVVDGVGELTEPERAALDAALADPGLADAISRVPLELGCADVAIDPGALAALFAPWQLALKYGAVDRLGAIRAAADASGCAYFLDRLDADLPKKPVTQPVLLGAEAPIPAVMTHFPFDAEGDVAQSTRAAGDLWGPCAAECRGACGIDCPSTCTRAVVRTCQLDYSGRRTGYATDGVRQSCGTATGCIHHDDCFDACNASHGCGTWDAGVCMHGVGGCNEVACLTYGVDTCVSWAAGGGPYESTLVFDYPLPAVLVQDLATCPVPTTGLMWQSSVSGALVTYADAEAACAAAGAGWRLPTLPELEGLEVGCPTKECFENPTWCAGCNRGNGPGPSGCYVDPSWSSPCNLHYWSSTEYPNPGIPELPRHWAWSPEWGSERWFDSMLPSAAALCVTP
jgi:hypothetical protein